MSVYMKLFQHPHQVDSTLNLYIGTNCQDYSTCMNKNMYLVVANNTTVPRSCTLCSGAFIITVCTVTATANVFIAGTSLWLLEWSLSDLDL